MKKEKKILLCILVVTIAIICGIGKEHHTVGEVHKTVNRYVTAEYRWTTTHWVQHGKTGHMSTTNHHRSDRWSNVWIFKYINNELKSVGTNGDDKPSINSYPENYGAVTKSHFKGYKNQEDISDIVLFLDGDSKTINESDHLKYIHSIGHEVEYRTWYGLKLWTMRGLEDS